MEQRKKWKNMKKVQRKKIIIHCSKFIEISILGFTFFADNTFFKTWNNQDRYQRC